jgi:glucan biosynthesis protein
VQARVFLRGEVGRLGIAPLTSMFLFGPTSNPRAATSVRPSMIPTVWRSTPAMANGCGVR